MICTKTWDVSLAATVTFTIFTEVTAPTAAEAEALALAEGLDELTHMRAPAVWTIDGIEAYSVKEQE